MESEESQLPRTCMKATPMAIQRFVVVSHAYSHWELQLNWTCSQSSLGIVSLCVPFTFSVHLTFLLCVHLRGPLRDNTFHNFRLVPLFLEKHDTKVNVGREVSVDAFRWATVSATVATVRHVWVDDVEFLNLCSGFRHDTLWLLQDGSV